MEINQHEEALLAQKLCEELTAKITSLTGKLRATTLNFAVLKEGINAVRSQAARIEQVIDQIGVQ